MRPRLVTPRDVTSTGRQGNGRAGEKTITTATSRQTDGRSTLPTRLGAPGPSHQRRGLRQAGSSTRGLYCPVAPVVCETTTSAQQKTRDQGMTKPPSLSSQPSLPTTKTSVEYNTNFSCVALRSAAPRTHHGQLTRKPTRGAARFGRPQGNTRTKMFKKRPEVNRP